MRSYLLIPMILLISCGKPNEQTSYGPAFNSTFKGQSLVATQIQCESIKTDFLDEDLTCPTTFLSEDKQFLFSIDEEKLSLDKVNTNSRVTLRISNKEDVQARLYLVSKYGKRLSGVVFYDGKSDLVFEELRRGDFLAHEVYLKVEDYYTGGTAPVTVRDEEDFACDTGLFKVEDVNLEDLRGQCPNLKVIPNLKAFVNAPVYFQNENYDMSNVEFSINARSTKNPLNGRTIHIPPPEYKFNFKVFKYMKEQDYDYSNFFNVTSSESGLLIEKKNDEICEVEGIISLMTRQVIGNKSWIKVKEDQVRNAWLGTVYINGHSMNFKSNYRVKKCYSVDPELVGTILIKE